MIEQLLHQGVPLLREIIQFHLQSLASILCLLRFGISGISSCTIPFTHQDITAQLCHSASPRFLLNAG
ncbi:Uncharacterised protein [Vibrio cholerae]|nr:Uncharacterised protein [Vibrio cholerae]